MLISLLVASLLLTSSTAFLLPNNHKSKDPWQIERIQSDLLLVQSEAMVSNRKKKYQNFTFNKFGHVDKSRRLKVNGVELVVYLGMGKSEIKSCDDSC